MEANLQRVLDGLLFVESFSALEFVGTSGGQARVKPNVLLVVGETPVGDAQLKLLGNRREPGEGGGGTRRKK